jgi:hypothetical protein
VIARAIGKALGTSALALILTLMVAAAVAGCLICRMFS